MTADLESRLDRALKAGDRADAKRAPLPEVIAFQLQGDGRRNRAFHVRGCTVLVTPTGDTSDDEAAEFSASLAALAAGHADRHFALLSRAASAEERLAVAGHELVIAQSRIPPPRPARLLGDGFVRFETDGRMWLLNRRERGWGEFGVIVDGWDDLFRRCNVRVAGHGVDEHGAWWAVSPIAEGK